ncbi:MAG: cation transporter [Bacteroidota bacterium]|nr:cation transporter [Bacteroidota bacterium]
MKILRNISLFTFMLAFFSFANLNAQTSTSSGTSKNAVIKIKTSGECEMCKKSLESAVGKMSGVKKAELDIDTKILTVEYNPKKTSPDKIRKVISGIGYDADDVKANNREQRSLPGCCKPNGDSMPK